MCVKRTTVDVVTFVILYQPLTEHLVRPVLAYVPIDILCRITTVHA